MAIDLYDPDRRCEPGEAGWRAPPRCYTRPAMPVIVASRSELAEKHARDFCARHAIEMIETPVPAPSVTARWRRESGEAMQRLLSHARHHDLIVMGAPQCLTGFRRIGWRRW